MERIEIRCYINGESDLGNSVLFISRTESWETILYKISLKVNKPQGSNSKVYNEIGGEITSAAEMEDDDIVYFAANGEAFIPPKVKETQPAMTKPVVDAANLSSTESKTSSDGSTKATTPTAPIMAAAPAYAPATSTDVNQPRISVVKPVNGPIAYSMRFIIVGSMSVGKSCLLLQFTDKKFAASMGPTIGVDFGSSTMNIDGDNVKLQIWDTAGQEDFQAITRAYYREAAAAILVYDVSNQQSYDKLQSWLSAVQTNATTQNIVITLVANKIDMREEEKIVTKEAGETFARENGLMFMEASAKTGYNVDNIFVDTAQEVVRRIKSGKIKIGEKDGVKLMNNGNEKTTQVTNNTVDKKKKCC